MSSSSAPLSLLAVRHAHPLTQGYADSNLYPLSTKGIATLTELNKLLLQEALKPTLLLSSPLLRAQQTADLIGERFGLERIDESALGSSFKVAVLLHRLNKEHEKHNKEHGLVIMVGHAPSLAEWVQELVGQRCLPYGLEKAEAALITFEGEIGYGKARFVRHFQPSMPKN